MRESVSFPLYIDYSPSTSTSWPYGVRLNPACRYIDRLSRFNEAKILRSVHRMINNKWVLE